MNMDKVKEYLREQKIERGQGIIVMLFQEEKDKDRCRCDQFVNVDVDNFDAIVRGVGETGKLVIESLAKAKEEKDNEQRRCC